MSRVGKKPITIPAGVEVTLNADTITVKGKLGEMSRQVPDCISVVVEADQVIVTRINEEKRSIALHGTTRSHIANMIEGVSNGYKKQLEINGVGYRAQMKGQTLVLQVGFSHPVEYLIPDGITITVPDPTNITVDGCDKQLVGLVGSRIRSFYPAEPYKGKGIKYKGEQIRRKAGKTVA
ncbi:MAG: 50S ribosomal protein L6 [Spartobacteria bacterium]|nr:50S ribosomal protein L6 [Spartobacteria bacterium]